MYQQSNLENQEYTFDLCDDFKETIEKPEAKSSIAEEIFIENATELVVEQFDDVSLIVDVHEAQDECDNYFDQKWLLDTVVNDLISYYAEFGDVQTAAYLVLIFDCS